MKKYIKFLLSVSLALCMVIGLGATIACTPNNNTDDDKNTFTITVKNEDGTPAAETWVQYCSDGEGAQCYPKRTDSNGKVTVDISTDEWKNSENIHITVFNLPANYSVYDEDDKIGAYDSVNDGYEFFIDHHEIKSVTLTIKQEPTSITAGYEYEESFLGGESKKYSTFVDANEAIFEAYLNGGEFDLSVVVNSNEPITETLNENNTSVRLELGTSLYGGNNVLIMLTPKTAAAADITFTLCPVYELGKLININGTTEAYKVYFNLPANTELTFSNPYGGPIPISGFPVKLTVGTDTTTWNSADDIAPISPTSTGTTPFLFEFGKAEEANLLILVENANAPSSDDVIVLGETIEIELPNMYDGKEFKFTSDSEEKEAYIITITGDTNAKVSYTDNISTWSEPYYASESNGVIEIELEAGVEYTITFGTDNESGDSYSVVVSKKAR